ncbi:family 1 glycosylhydrolase [uncultured Aquimarina sp.]|uniref:family 1 glycosylhydrolase n=1 Tax=uncultured Aquimarina sp. TaxID=575652 RepID=UPI00262B9511|nr:family 1 glycosylhydrolase [uncultured Aquimarina sp.]
MNSHSQINLFIKNNAFIFSFILILISSWSINGQVLKDEVPAGKYIGTIVNGSFFNGNNTTPSGAYQTTIVEQFNSIVAENDHKMENLLKGSAANNPFNITLTDINTDKLDRMINFADANGITVKRGHALMWYSQAPQWLRDDAAGWTKQQIFDFAESYITTVMTYTKGKIDEWDVFNEIINDNSAGFRSGTWYANVGNIQDFIDHCFIVAKSVDPDVVLFYNDYSIETFNTDPNSKNAFMRTMIQGMIERGIPIDALGLQSHFENGIGDSFTDQVSQTMDFAIDLGLICNITELDIRICNNGQPASEEELQAQKDSYQRIAAMALAKDGCTGLTLWGFTDASSWVPGFFDGCGSALIYDNNYQPKPSFTGLLNGLQGITVGEDNGGCGGATVAQAPFNGTPITIPGIIEFENYDIGGEGVAYQDDDTSNNGGSTYRDCDATDIVLEESGSLIIGWLSPGEWLEYTINVSDSGSYDFTFSTAADTDFGGEGSLELDGVDISGLINFASTGGWSNFQNTLVTEIPLTEGEHILRFNVESGSFNVDKMTASINTLGTNDYGFNTAENFKAYPIPFNKELNINYNTIGETSSINLIDIHGRKVFSQKYTNEDPITIHTGNISSGMYFLQINRKDNSSKIVKIIKQ